MNEVEENLIQREEISLCINKIEKHRLNKQAIIFKKIVCITLLSFLFMIIMLIGGVLANSLVIISESAYIFSNFSGLTISLIAISSGNKPSTKIFTYGFHRTEVISKLISIISIWLISAFIIKDALDRINNPGILDAKIMLFISILGFIFGLLVFNILQNSYPEYSNDIQNNEYQINCKNPDEKNMNEELNNNKEIGEISITVNNKTEGHKIKSNIILILDEEYSNKFMLSLFGEIIKNSIIVTSAIMINLDHKWVIIDAICSLILIGIVLLGTLTSSKDCIVILMEATPEKYQIDKIENYLMKKV